MTNCTCGHLKSEHQPPPLQTRCQAPTPNHHYGPGMWEECNCRKYQPSQT